MSLWLAISQMAGFCSLSVTLSQHVYALMEACCGGLHFSMPLLSSPYFLSHYVGRAFHYPIYLRCLFIPGFFIVWSCCQMVTHWVWSWVIITFISSQEMRCSFPFSRRVMPWSSLCSVVRHCFALAFIRWYNIVLYFDVAHTGGLLCPSFWSTSRRRWGCCSIAICDTTGFKLMRLWAHGHTCQVHSWLHSHVIVQWLRSYNLSLCHWMLSLWSAVDWIALQWTIE